MFYATIDSDGGCISQDAHIAKFATRAEAEEYLRGPFDTSEWSVAIEAGSFGDCWIKTYNKPDRELTDYCDPFAWDDMIVLAPGQHPGGRCWWIEPRSDVLVAIPTWIGED